MVDARNRIVFLVRLLQVRKPLYIRIHLRPIDSCLTYDVQEQTSASACAVLPEHISDVLHLIGVSRGFDAIRHFRIWNVAVTEVKPEVLRGMPATIALPVREIESRVTKLSATDAVLLAGSQSLGLAHANSDYDIYVVTEVTIPAVMEYGSKTYYEDTLIDVSYVHSSTVERFTEVLRTSDDLAPSDLDADDLELMWRLVIGTPIANEDACERVKEVLGRQRVADLIGRWRAQNAQVRYLDGLFLMAHDSNLAAAVALRESAVEAACAVITEAGYAYFDTKYLFDQCAMAGPRYESLLGELWGIESLSLVTTAIAEIHSRCQQLGARWIGGAFADAAAQDTWANAMVRRSLAHALELAGPGVVVWNRSETTTLEGDAARMWEALDGALDPSIAELSKRTDLPLFRCGQAFHELFIQGLIRLDWTAVIADRSDISSEVGNAS